MSLFEFVLAFSSVISALALGHLLADLVAFHEREGHNYFWAMAGLGCIALLFNLIFSGIFGSWLRDSLLTLVALGFTFLAILVKAQWAQRLSAVAIAGIATYFLIAASTLGTA